jgi:dipeptidyl aminopeptidase/acylaminoacyl peptidase
VTYLSTALVVALIALGACGLPNHHLVHPHEPPWQIITWSADFGRDQLLVHVEGARPPGPGPFPTVLVHPEGGKTAADMHGVIWDLAARGYVALAADYQRLIGGQYRRSLFAWRSAADVTMIVDVTRAYPEADQNRIGVLGFSQGGVYSLLMAAHAPDRIKAVVSYYPVTDFPHWFALERPDPLRRWAHGVVRWYFRRESGAASDAKFEEMLRQASPYYAAESIRAPVLLVHGERDTTASVEESQRMAERLAAAGQTVKLLVVPGGTHIFNFRQPEQAAVAWDATVAWLKRYLRQEGADPAGWLP